MMTHKLAKAWWQQLDHQVAEAASAIPQELDPSITCMVRLAGYEIEVDLSFHTPAGELDYVQLTLVRMLGQNLWQVRSPWYVRPKGESITHPVAAPSRWLVPREVHEMLATTLSQRGFLQGPAYRQCRYYGMLFSLREEAYRRNQWFRNAMLVTALDWLSRKPSGQARWTITNGNQLEVVVSDGETSWEVSLGLLIPQAISLAGAIQHDTATASPSGFVVSLFQFVELPTPELRRSPRKASLLLVDPLARWLAEVKAPAWAVKLVFASFGVRLDENTNARLLLL